MQWGKDIGNTIREELANTVEVAVAGMVTVADF